VRDGPPYRYRTDILEQLLRHGVRPTERTRPELAHEFVGDLYRHELRALRDQLLAKAFPKPEYFERVVSIRNRYRILAMKPHEWLE